MCGINGIVRLSREASAISGEELRATRDQMASRGPDGIGEWFAPSGDAALGHRRLAIIDLSPAGLQPMVRSGRYHIVYNGEIYNYRELRDELSARGVRFETSSDTEVILALYECHGPKMLEHLRGMYALAIWDSHSSSLFLARDPYGIKPLYYSQASDGTFRFASQVKALEESAAVSTEVDPAGLVGFLIWGSVPEPLTIRRAIRALPAGHCLTVADGRVSGPNAFADFERLSEPANDCLDPGSAIEESVRYHLVSDVPIGIFLSAGLDSTVIASLAARQLDEPITTFTVTFDAYRGTHLDEGPLAAEVARILGARHIEHTVKAEEFEVLWAEAFAAMDQPSIDGFNTFLVSKIAHRYGLKVVLSGLGGDELLGSYPSFRDVPRWASWSRLGARIPGAGVLLPRLAQAFPGRPKLAGMLSYGTSLAASYLMRRGLFLPREIPGLIGDALAREGLQAYDPLPDIEKCLPTNGGGRPGSADWTAVHLMESTLYLRNQLLPSSDWASMAHSLELRVPFVDTALRRQLAAHDFEPARSRGKAVLFRSIAADLPAEIWRRPKSGFMVPVMEMFGSDPPSDRSTHGLDSRQLALRVLNELGVDGIRLTQG